MYPAAPVTGTVAPGYSTGQGLAALERLATDRLPAAMAFEWTELAFLERQSGATGMLVFGLSVVFVFLVLAALYESWSLPLAVILVVPMCVLSSIAGVALGMLGARTGYWQGITDINIFTQVGFVVLIGLACKNAIIFDRLCAGARPGGAGGAEPAAGARVGAAVVVADEEHCGQAR
jgi:multidrug efflux pump